MRRAPIEHDKRFKEKVIYFQATPFAELAMAFVVFSLGFIRIEFNFRRSEQIIACTTRFSDVIELRSMPLNNNNGCAALA